MKKLIVILSAAFVFLALAACGTGNNKTGTTTTTNSANTGVVGNVMDDIENGVLGAEDAIMSAADHIIGGEDDIIGDEREDSLMANDDIAADNSINSTTSTMPGDSARGRMTDAGTTSRKTSSLKEGELNQLASLVGRNEDIVISTLGRGRNVQRNEDNSISKEFDIIFCGEKEKATIFFSSRGRAKTITVSPKRKRLVASLLALTKVFGEPDKISSDGLSYDYLAQWNTENADVTLHKWHDIVTITME